MPQHVPPVVVPVVLAHAVVAFATACTTARDGGNRGATDHMHNSGNEQRALLQPDNRDCRGNLDSLPAF